MVRRKRKFGRISRGSGGRGRKVFSIYTGRLEEQPYVRGKGFFTLNSVRIGSPRIANNISRFMRSQVKSHWGEEYF